MDMLINVDPAEQRRIESLAERVMVDIRRARAGVELSGYAVRRMETLVAWLAGGISQDAVDRIMIEHARDGLRDGVEALKPHASAEGRTKAENILDGVDAAARGDQAAVDAWWARQGFTDEQRETLLWTCGTTTDAMALLFIAIARDVNVRDEHGEPPLMRAVEYGRLEVVRMLIAAGADVASIDRALYRARRNGHERVAELLTPYASDDGRHDAEVVS